jgi:trypsin-like peptidase
VAFLRLKGADMLQLRDLLKPAFPRDQFEELLLRLDRNTADYAGASDPYPTVILKTLQSANAQLWWRELLRDAVNAASQDLRLKEFAAAVGFASDILSAQDAQLVPLRGKQLELKIKESGSLLDILPWRQRVAEIEGRVCRIEFPDLQPHGTGFLVAPDLVITNYHVIEAVHLANVPSNVAIRFDYKILVDGISVGPGRCYRLAKDWLVDYSPYSERDFESEPKGDAPEDELDYALLRIAERAGDEPIGGDSGAAASRHWIEMPTTAHDFAQDPTLIIIQHADGKPMQIALDTNAIIGATTTRVRYATTTLPGSSGSPCFGANWDWVALHHSGDPRHWKQGIKPMYNQGIPTAAILRLTSKRGISGLLRSH